MKITLKEPNIFQSKIESIINSSLIKRLFRWKPMIIILSEIQALVSEAMQANQYLNVENEDLHKKVMINENNSLHNTDELRDLNQKNVRLQDQVTNLTTYKKENDDLQKKVNHFRQIENSNKREYENAVTQLSSTQQIIQNREDKRLENEERERSEELERKRKTWKEHQDLTQSTIKTLCDVHGISYIDDFPFEGKSPDNTIKVVDNYVIFDAKSPANDNLDNFPTYIKSQVKGIGKYGKYKEVHKHLYLVIPSNTAEIIKQKTYRDSNYTVHIITLDSIETILLSLKQREVYEYIEKLSPEESDCIERFISYFINSGKRRAQIDFYLNDKFFVFIEENMHHLPEKIRKNALVKEAGEKLNPPNQQINKTIDMDEEKAKHDKYKQILLLTHEVKEINQLNIQENEGDN